MYIFQISTNVVLPSESVMSTPFVRIPLALTIVLVKLGTVEMEKHAEVGPQNLNKLTPE